MPITSHLTHHKWPKRHAHVVEECKALHVDTALAHLDSYHRTRSALQSWTPYPHLPHLILVSRMGGPFKRWWWECPFCQRRCEDLYVPPGAADWDLRCRKCWNLIYASQRYGESHPLREKLTRRKRKTVQKEIDRLLRFVSRNSEKFEEIPLPGIHSVISAKRE